MSVFETRDVKPMLLGENHAPFDDPSFIFELKADGIRGLAYLDPTRGTDLRNKRNMLLAGTFPELSELHLQVDKPCILDGEIIVTGPGGAPDFFQVQKRALMSNRTKISLAASQQPATFLAFDILYLDGEELFFIPLVERKALLADTVREGGRLALSRYVEGHGVALYQLRPGIWRAWWPSPRRANTFRGAGPRTGKRSSISWMTTM